MRINHINQVIPAPTPEFRRALAELSRRNWVRVEHVAGVGLTYKFDTAVIASVLAKLSPNASMGLSALVRVCAESAVEMAAVFAASKCAETGLRVFRPTLAQCTAMSKVDLTLQVSEYTQPFAAMVVEFPEDFRKYVAELYAERVGTSVPVGMLVTHFNGTIIVVSLSPGKSRDGSIVLVFNEGATVTLEQALRSRNQMDGAALEMDGKVLDPTLTEDDWTMGQCVGRCALNLCLWLSGNALVSMPDDPKQHAKTVKLSRSGDAAQRERARDILASSATVLTLADQSIEVYDREPGASHESIGATGRTQRPHWRRGHWRVLNPDVNARWKQLQRLFIKPILIHREAVAAADTATTSIYRGHP